MFSSSSRVILCTSVFLNQSLLRYLVCLEGNMWQFSAQLKSRSGNRVIPLRLGCTGNSEYSLSLPENQCRWDV
ncbi:hypothetical protein F5878DRAFT_618754 [Lentinula raphanica]|uniref:Uncharacterized protein n=1 Tax=Lentinula raphanica TaxID=153919 RepID=A0AA38P9X8_9AGAR|nr:hypothetical protein F5878DRAFT_618754 [Lentinula raphanica]